MSLKINTVKKTNFAFSYSVAKQLLHFMLINNYCHVIWIILCASNTANDCIIEIGEGQILF